MMDSKLYLSGIEIPCRARPCRLAYPPNCTLVELKYLDHHAGGARAYTPNCTLVELKCTVCHSDYRAAPSPNCTLVELK